MSTIRYSFCIAFLHITFPATFYALYMIYFMTAFSFIIAFIQNLINTNSCSNYVITQMSSLLYRLKYWTSIPNSNRHQMLGRHLCYHYTNAGYKVASSLLCMHAPSLSTLFLPREAVASSAKMTNSPFAVLGKFSNPLGMISHTNAFGTF